MGYTPLYFLVHRFSEYLQKHISSFIWHLHFASFFLVCFVFFQLVVVTQPFQLWHLQRVLPSHLPPRQTSAPARSLTPPLCSQHKYQKASQGGHAWHRSCNQSACDGACGSSLHCQATGTRHVQARHPSHSQLSPPMHAQGEVRGQQE